MSADQRVRRLPAPLSGHVPGYSVRAETTLGGEGSHPSRRTLLTQRRHRLEGREGEADGQSTDAWAQSRAPATCGDRNGSPWRTSLWPLVTGMARHIATCFAQ